MSEADERSEPSDKSLSQRIAAKLSKSAGLVILGLIVAFVLLRMMSPVLKLIILVAVVGAIVYFVKVGREDPTIP